MTAWKSETSKGICGSDAAVGADSGPEFGELGREGGVDGEWIPGVELLHRTAFGQLGVDVDPAPRSTPARVVAIMGVSTGPG
jgi:hypothetical protein